MGREVSAQRGLWKALDIFLESRRLRLCVGYVPGKEVTPLLRPILGLGERSSNSAWLVEVPKIYAELLSKGWVFIGSRRISVHHQLTNKLTD